MLYRTSSLFEFRVKTWRKSHFSSTSGQCCFVTDTSTFSPSSIKSLDPFGFARIKVECFFSAWTVLALLCSFVLNTKPVWSNFETVLKLKFSVQGNSY